MASIAALKGIGSIPAYSAAKGGIVAMTRSIAVHCQDKGYEIRVNAIAPGGIVTPMTDFARGSMPEADPGSEAPPARGMGQPSDIASMVLYLACDDGRHITGSTITIDNGDTIR